MRHNKYDKKLKKKKKPSQSQIILIVSFLATCILQVIIVSFKINPFIDDGDDDKKALIMPQLGPQRIFTPYQYQFPCYEGLAFNDNAAKRNESASLNGLMYVKIPKTASSTTSGINLRIAYRHAPKYIPDKKKCAATWMHHTSLELQVAQRDKKKTFLWTHIRNTKSIINSNFFWSRRFRKNNTATFKEFKEYAENPKKISKQFRFLQTREVDYDSLVNNKQIRDEAIQEILNEYDFIG